MGSEPSSITILPFHGTGRARRCSWRSRAELLGTVPGQGVPLSSMDLKVSTELYWLATEVETGQVCGALHK